jgi:hypothetical protein
MSDEPAHRDERAERRERRRERERQRMKKHGARTGEVYRNAVLKRLKERAGKG